MEAEAMTHTALKMARDALAFYAAADCWRAQEVLPVIEAALQSTHPADASKVGAQIDMRDSVPSAEPRTLTDAQIERHTFAAGECPPNSQVILVSSIRRLLGYTGTPTAPAPAQAEVTTGSIPAPMTEADEARLKVALGGVFGWATCPTTAATHAANGTAIAGGRPAPAQAEPVAAREVARQVFEVCEDYEATPETPGDSQEVERFKAGVRFAAKRIRGAIGAWLTDEEIARATPPAAAAPLAQPLTEARILEMAAEAETPAWGEWYTDEDALFKFARAVEAHKGQP